MGDALLADAHRLFEELAQAQASAADDLRAFKKRLARTHELTPETVRHLAEACSDLAGELDYSRQELEDEAALAAQLVAERKGTPPTSAQSSKAGRPGPAPAPARAMLPPRRLAKATRTPGPPPPARRRRSSCGGPAEGAVDRHNAPGVRSHTLSVR